MSSIICSAFFSSELAFRVSVDNLSDTKINDTLQMEIIRWLLFVILDNRILSVSTQLNKSANKSPC